MRVISGTARSLKLKTPSGRETRPTSDRIKETLFNILAPRIAGSCVLDLFAGSGALGIEALSRGAERAVFIENDPEACRCIRENLRHTKLEERATLHKCEVISALGRLTDPCFDLIFIDPPYREGYEEQVLKALAEQQYMGEESLIILETALDNDPAAFLPSAFFIEKEKLYKTNKHLFIRPQLV
jgi:16S rRNA (guanine966-N2)-methyltransferase